LIYSILPAFSGLTSQFSGNLLPDGFVVHVCILLIPLIQMGKRNPLKEDEKSWRLRVKGGKVAWGREHGAWSGNRRPEPGNRTINYLRLPAYPEQLQKRHEVAFIAIRLEVSPYYFADFLNRNGELMINGFYRNLQ